MQIVCNDTLLKIRIKKINYNQSKTQNCLSFCEEFYSYRKICF